MNPQLCFIKESYFQKNVNFVKMLDAGDTVKQSKRTHICIKVSIGNNNFCIPLRNNLGDEVRKYGRIGHAVPSNKRKNAGLDYRYALIVNDMGYIETHKQRKIPNSQYVRLKNDYDIIRSEFAVYLRGFKRAAQKHRINKEPLFRESSLINFLVELGLN